MLLIDVKGAFDLVNRNCLLWTMKRMHIDSDLMRWTEPFM